MDNASYQCPIWEMPYNQHQEGRYTDNDLKIKILRKTFSFI